MFEPSDLLNLIWWLELKWWISPDLLLPTVAHLCIQHPDRPLDHGFNWFDSLDLFSDLITLLPLHSTVIPDPFVHPPSPIYSPPHVSPEYPLRRLPLQSALDRSFSHEASNVIAIVKKYWGASGQAVNFDNCGGYFSKKNVHFKNQSLML